MDNETWRMFNNLKEKGVLIPIEQDNGRVIVKVNWHMYRKLYPERNHRVYKTLKRIEGKTEDRVLSRMIKTLSILHNEFNKRITEYEDARRSPKLLTDLEKAGLLHIDRGSGRVIVTDTHLENLEKIDYLNKTDKRDRLLPVLMRINGSDIGSAELYLRYKYNQKGERFWEVMDAVKYYSSEKEEHTDDLEDIEVVVKEGRPPFHVNIKDFPSKHSWIVPLFVLGKLVEQGIITRNRAAQAVKKGVDAIKDVVAPYLTGSSKIFGSRTSLESAVNILRETVNKNTNNHHHFIAAYTGRCPACGSQVIQRKGEYECTGCRKRYKNVGKEVIRLEIDRKKVTGFKLKDTEKHYERPDLYPFILVKEGNNYKVAVNNLHPLVKVLKRKR